MIPTWLQRHLEATGRWNSDGVARRVSGGHCLDCRAQVIRGLDSDPAGLPVTCDPQPLDQLGEALALVAGRSTYGLTRTADRWQLDQRSRWRIAGGRRALVLAAHRCGAPPLPAEPPEPTFDALCTCRPEEPCF